MVFAATAVTFLTFVGLGTETGTWYLARRNGQNAADAAAMAGALAVFWANYPNACVSGTALASAASAASASATDVASRNGFVAGSGIALSASSPPTTGSYTADHCAAQARITQTRAPLFVTLTGFKGTIPISTNATARLQPVPNLGGVCALSLAGDMSLGGSSTTTGQNCVMASNGTDANAINIYGEADVTAQSLYTTGGCSGCSNADLSTPAQANQALPVANPYAPLDAAALPALACNSTSLSSVRGTTTLNPTYALTGFTPPYPSNGGTAWCGDLSLHNGDVVKLTPGTYFFYPAGNGKSIDLTGGTLECWDPHTNALCASPVGVTIVLTDTNGNGGSVKINGGANVLLVAPQVNTWNAAASGLIFYQADRGSSVGSVTINGNASDTLTGGMYFPGAAVSIDGTAGISSVCTTLIAASITASGNSDSFFDNSGCSVVNGVGVGTKVAQIVAPQLWE